MANDERPQVVLEDVRIQWRNFAGKEGQYNAEGDRNFAVILTPELADDLAAQGWNVKEGKVDEEGNQRPPYLSVTVGYRSRPPLVVMITDDGKNRTFLDESTVSILDWADMANIDMVLNGYVWDVNGKTGTKAYLKSLFVTINEDPLEKKYGINAAPSSEQHESHEQEG